jgi:CO dehydrogenase/acetyl-CoA synthase epsilon subunit
MLTLLFPSSKGYLVIGRDRVVDDDKKSAELMVKLLRHDHVVDDNKKSADLMVKLLRHDHVVDDNKKSADLMVKLLRHDHVTVVFTMSNKRASHQHMKDKAVKQLAEYMKLEHTNRTQEGSEPRGIDRQGAVRIRTKVSFYDYRVVELE